MKKFISNTKQFNRIVPSTNINTIVGASFIDKLVSDAESQIESLVSASFAVNEVYDYTSSFDSRIKKTFNSISKNENVVNVSKQLNTISGSSYNDKLITDALSQIQLLESASYSNTLIYDYSSSFDSRTHTTFNNKTKESIDVFVSKPEKDLVLDFRKHMLDYTSTMVFSKVGLIELIDYPKVKLTLYNTLLETANIVHNSGFEIFVNGVKVSTDYTIEQIGDKVEMVLLGYVGIVENNKDKVNIYVNGKFILSNLISEEDEFLLTEDGNQLLL